MAKRPRLSSSETEQLTIDGELAERTPAQLTLDGGYVGHWDVVEDRDRQEREAKEQEAEERRREQARRNPPIDYTRLEPLPFEDSSLEP